MGMQTLAWIYIFMKSLVPDIHVFLFQLILDYLISRNADGKKKNAVKAQQVKNAWYIITRASA